MSKTFTPGDKVRFGRIHGEYRGQFHDDIAMVLTDEGARLYYIHINELTRDEAQARKDTQEAHIHPLP